MRNLSQCLLLGVAFVWLSGGVALAQGDPCRGCDPSAQNGDPWCETFESYEVGEQPPVNGWLGPFTVTDEENHTPGGEKSGALDQNDDVVRLFEAYDVNAAEFWTLVSHVFIPSNMQGDAYWIVNSDYELEKGSTTWAIQCRMTAQEGIIHDDFGGGELPLRTDQWVELRAEIDLVADWVQLFYHGQLLGQYEWSIGGGSARIRALDFYNNAGTRFYYDDLSVCPAEPPLDGDFDNDGDVDLFDFERFLDCVTGPGAGLIPPGCGVFDFDSDADIDLADAGAFLRAFTGSGGN